MEYENKNRKRDFLSLLESKYHKLKALDAKITGEIDRVDFEYEKMEEKRSEIKAMMKKLGYREEIEID